MAVNKKMYWKSGFFDYPIKDCVEISVEYWQELLDYLNYDPTYIKLFVQAYNSQYDILEDLKQPKEFQYAKQKKIQKEVRKAIWQYRIKNFWNK